MSSPEEPKPASIPDEDLELIALDEGFDAFNFFSWLPPAEDTSKPRDFLP